MKTPLCFLAALVAFFALPIDFYTMISVLFAAGLAVIAISDYRGHQRLVPRRTPARSESVSCPQLRMAA